MGKQDASRRRAADDPVRDDELSEAVVRNPADIEIHELETIRIEDADDE